MIVVFSVRVLPRDLMTSSRVSAVPVRWNTPRRLCPRQPPVAVHSARARRGSGNHGTQSCGCARIPRSKIAVLETVLELLRADPRGDMIVAFTCTVGSKICLSEQQFLNVQRLPARGVIAIVRYVLKGRRCGRPGGVPRSDAGRQTSGRSGRRHGGHPALTQSLSSRFVIPSCRSGSRSGQLEFAKQYSSAVQPPCGPAARLTPKASSAVVTPSPAHLPGERCLVLAGSVAYCAEWLRYPPPRAHPRIARRLPATERCS